MMPVCSACLLGLVPRSSGRVFDEVRATPSTVMLHLACVPLVCRFPALLRNHQRGVPERKRRAVTTHRSCGQPGFSLTGTGDGRRHSTRASLRLASRASAEPEPALNPAAAALPSRAASRARQGRDKAVDVGGVEGAHSGALRSCGAGLLAEPGNPIGGPCPTHWKHLQGVVYSAVDSPSTSPPCSAPLASKQGGGSLLPS
jgi:hypothetical protein